MSVSEVLTVADARKRLSDILRTYREDPAAEAVIVGSHRRPEVVITPIHRFAADEATPREAALDALMRQRGLIRRIARLNRIDDVAVFGSVARRQETPESDVDLLVTPASDASLFDFAQFEIDMEQLCGRPIDVVSRRALGTPADAAILTEAVPL